eukprot:11952455-Prorocentrum_lima.AAC.1
MRERLFKDGAAPLYITVGILTADVPNIKNVIEASELVLLSPEEVVMAFWDELRDKKSDDGWGTAVRLSLIHI